MNIIDLFSGVGGLSLGFKRLGFNILIANEIDSEIARSYELNHPDTIMLNKDITALDVESVFSKYIGGVDVVIGGPPCQGFSQKGSRKSIKDDRNFLFRYFYNVIKYLTPGYFLMENVPEILTANDGLFKDEIINIFEKIGYEVDYKVLNSSVFGVPQIRKRAFFLGKYGGFCNLPNRSKTCNVTIDDAIGDLAYLESGEGTEMAAYRFSAKTEYQIKMRANSSVLFNHVSTKHSKSTIEKMKMIPPGCGKEVLPEKLLTKSIYSGTWSRMLPNEQSVTITTRFDTPSSGRFMHPTLNRCITSREAARIQSFPDDFIFYGTKGSQMKQIGNAVPPLLGQAIAETIKKDIKHNL